MASKKPELLITLDSRKDTALYQQVYDSLRRLILSGTLAEGEKLPSIRGLSAQLGLSHATVERAYSQLVVEGYVRNVPRSGYVVNRIDIAYFNQASDDNAQKVAAAIESAPVPPFRRELVAGSAARYNFSYADLQPGSFPERVWLQLYAETLRSFPAGALSAYDRSNRPNSLQIETARYLQQSRGVVCEPEQIMFLPGTEAAIGSVLQLISAGLKRVGHEEPGYEVMTAVARRIPGARLVPLPVDKGSKAFLDALERGKPQLVFVTPSHQFPTGRVMPLETRVQLLQWAHRNNAYIIEDDSCNEYRYGMQAVPSLQSLDRHHRVIYLCNFSKALSPGLRCAYLVLPPELLARWLASYSVSWDHTPYVMRETLARFMAEGHWAQHLRRMTTGSRHRHDLLMERLEAELGDMVQIEGAGGGMHLFATVHNGMDNAELVESALAQGAAVHGTAQYWFSRPAPPNNLLIGFGAIKLEDIPDGVRALRRAWTGE